MVPMVEQVMARCGQAPEAWLVDGGFVGHEQIEQASQHTVVYGPVPEPKDKTVDPHQAKATDSPAVGAWRERMGTDEAKEIYKKRAATAECVNAQSRNRGLQQFPVRGLAKVTCVVLLFCPGAQPDAHGRLGATVARDRDRYVLRPRNRTLRAKNMENQQMNRL
jgi:hypothetical protein